MIYIFIQENFILHQTLFSVASFNDLPDFNYVSYTFKDNLLYLIKTENIEGAMDRTYLLCQIRKKIFKKLEATMICIDLFP